MEFRRKLGISKSKKLVVEIGIGVVLVMGFSSETTLSLILSLNRLELRKWGFQVRNREE